MDVKEKLVELLEPHVSGLACEYESGSCELTSCRSCNARNLADHLISNGVTVQQWIPVNDKRKPKEGEDVLVAVFDGYDTYTDMDCLMRDGKWCFETENYKVTHWMEKPQPPKGE